MSASDDEEVPIAVGITDDASMPQLGSGFEADDEIEERAAPVPVTLITGCLGAGELSCHTCQAILLTVQQCLSHFTILWQAKPRWCSTY